jgi:murein DD-endopeptidase MepM/ murein hydrolase activator NlpD
MTPSGRAVDKENDVGATIETILDDGELIDREPIVVLRIFKIHEPRLRVNDSAIARVFDADAFDEQAIERAVIRDERGMRGARHLAVRVFERVGGESGIEARERVAQTARQDDLCVIVAFGGEFARRNVGTMPEGVAEFAQPSERGVFDDGFGERLGHERITQSDACLSAWYAQADLES